MMNALSGYLPLAQDKRQVSWLRIPFGKLAWVTVSLPLFSFIFCVIWSVFFNFEKATFTHCKVRYNLKKKKSTYRLYLLTLFNFFFLTVFSMFRLTIICRLSLRQLAILALSEMFGEQQLVLMHFHGYWLPQNITAFIEQSYINGHTFWLQLPVG